MGRLKKVTGLSKLCRYLSLFLKTLMNFVTMRGLLTRVVNRVLLSELFTPAMGIEAEMHTEGRRRMVSVITSHIIYSLCITLWLHVYSTLATMSSLKP